MSVLPNLSEWKRVRIAQWTSDKKNQVLMRRLRRVPGKPVELEKEHYQLSDNLIGITVPVQSKYGIVVMPLSFLDTHGREYVKVDPTVYYFIVPEAGLSYLGEAYDEEILRVRRGLRAHGLKAPLPDMLLMQRVRERMAQGVDAFEAQTLEADERKGKTKARR